MPSITTPVPLASRGLRLGPGVSHVGIAHGRADLDDRIADFALLVVVLPARRHCRRPMPIARAIRPERTGQVADVTLAQFIRRVFIARLACGCRMPIEKTHPAARVALIESSQVEPVRPRSTRDRRERTIRIDQTGNHLIPFRAGWIVRRHPRSTCNATVLTLRFFARRRFPRD